MKTKIKQEGDITIIQIEGKIDYETQDPFREDLRRIAKSSKTDTAATKIIFDFQGLEFVGSSGISNLIHTLKEFNKIAHVRPRYCNVRSEFQKIIKAFDEDCDFDIYESQDKAGKSFIDQ